MKMKTREVVLCALFIALTALGARINFPLPMGNYYSLQFLFVLLAGMLLGPGYGALSLGLYVVLGLVGFPLFAAGGGFAYVVKPTFGFLLGFIMAAFVSGLLVQKLSRRAGENPSSKSYHRDLPRYFIAALGGLVVTYGFGIFYMYVANNFFLGAKVPLWAVFVSCFPIDIPCDLGLCVIAALLGPRLCALVKKEL
ncbi:MAG: biotin transporter BioY [Bacillota bacterium]|nr:biotin transporter BioY [Bacillota bacterium]